MLRRRLAGILAGAGIALAVAVPAFAHGDHDARALARSLEAGPYRISLWQVWPDAGSAMEPVVIVLFDGLASVPAGIEVEVQVNGVPVTAGPSTTTPNGWETHAGVGAADVVTVSIADGPSVWHLGAVVVPVPPTSMLPMRELLIATIVLTAIAAVWVLARTRRAWRWPAYCAG